MPQRLLIHYAGPGRPLAWLALGDHDRPLSAPGAGDAPPPAAIAAAGEIVVVVPGNDVLLAGTDVAARSREQLARAIPFALEEQFAEPVEQLHVAFVANSAGGQDVAAIRADTLRAWLDDLATRGVHPDAMIAEPLAVAHVPGQVVVLIDGEQAIARTARHDGFVAPGSQLAELLGFADVPRDADGRVGVTMVAPAGEAPGLGAGFVVHNQARAATALHEFARALAGDAVASQPNLATGAFATKQRGAPVRRYWRIAALLAGVAVALGLLGVIVDRWSLSRRVAAIDAAMFATYREVYPDGRPVPDPAARMRADYQTLRGGGDAQGALGLLSRVAPALAENARVVVKAMEYRGGTLDVTLVAPGVQDLDAAREKAATLTGLRVELASATTTPQGAEGRLRIAGGPR